MSRFAPTIPPAVECLQPFVEAGVLSAADVHLAATAAGIEPGTAPDVLLGLAVAARGPALGHVCVDLRHVTRLVTDRGDDPAADLQWPDLDSWIAALSASALVAHPDVANGADGVVPPMVIDGTRLYLQRYHRYECSLAASIRDRAAASGFDTADDASRTLVDALDALFGVDDPAAPDLQRRAADVALTHGLSIIAGGPGTGKTRTIARLLAAAQRAAIDHGRPLDVALAAPTGKAAARMAEAVRLEVTAAETDGAISSAVAAGVHDTEATTIHSLLGWAPGTRFRHDRHRPLHHDLVIVDETSMAALPLMSRLVDAVRPDARLVLVGDPSQLASVEAGTVLADLVGPTQPDGSQHSGPLSGRVTVLERARRFSADSAIAALADAIRRGATDDALAILQAAHDDVSWVRDDDSDGLEQLQAAVIDGAADVVRYAIAGNAAEGLRAATRVKVLAATRHHPLGLIDWSRRIEDGVAEQVPTMRRRGRWYVGRPIIVTANDRLTRVSNGDVGLVVHSDPGGTSVAFALGEQIRHVPTSRLDQVDSWWAMTIHKSQGSEFDHAVVSLPPAGSPILTRELLYTAVTRAKQRVTVVGSDSAIREAIERPVARASGLGERLWTGGTSA